VLLAIGLAAQCAAACCSPDPLRAVALLVGAGAAVVSAATDAASGLVFDLVTIPAAFIAACLELRAHSAAWAFGGVAVCAGTLLLVYAVTNGRGLGLGDVKLAAAIGAVLGAQDALGALGIAFISGGAYAAFVLATGRAHRGAAMRFAPYLTAGMLSVALYRVAP
jgi:prepilin signal peptidase PulO-like enzyme (type II secretory pathway)